MLSIKEENLNRLISLSKSEKGTFLIQFLMPDGSTKWGTIGEGGASTVSELFLRLDDIFHQADIFYGSNARR